MFEKYLEKAIAEAHKKYGLTHMVEDDKCMKCKCVFIRYQKQEAEKLSCPAWRNALIDYLYKK